MTVTRAILLSLNTKLFDCIEQQAQTEQEQNKHVKHKLHFLMRKMTLLNCAQYLYGAQ